MTKRRKTKRTKKRKTKRGGQIPISVLKKRYAKLGNIIMKRKGHYAD